VIFSNKGTTTMYLPNSAASEALIKQNFMDSIRLELLSANKSILEVLQNVIDSIPLTKEPWVNGNTWSSDQLDAAKNFLTSLKTQLENRITDIDTGFSKVSDISGAKQYAARPENRIKSPFVYYAMDGYYKVINGVTITIPRGLFSSSYAFISTNFTPSKIKNQLGDFKSYFPQKESYFPQKGGVRISKSARTTNSLLYTIESRANKRASYESSNKSSFVEVRRTIRQQAVGFINASKDHISHIVYHENKISNKLKDPYFLFNYVQEFFPEVFTYAFQMFIIARGFTIYIPNIFQIIQESMTPTSIINAIGDTIHGIASYCNLRQQALDKQLGVFFYRKLYQASYPYTWDRNNTYNSEQTTDSANSTFIYNVMEQIIIYAKVFCDYNRDVLTPHLYNFFDNHINFTLYPINSNQILSKQILTRQQQDHTYIIDTLLNLSTTMNTHTLNEVRFSGGGETLLSEEAILKAFEVPEILPESFLTNMDSILATLSADLYEQYYGLLIKAAYEDKDIDAYQEEREILLDHYTLLLEEDPMNQILLMEYMLYTMEYTRLYNKPYISKVNLQTAMSRQNYNQTIQEQQILKERPTIEAYGGRRNSQKTRKARKQSRKMKKQSRRKRRV
jgi:hypothetical protein